MLIDPYITDNDDCPWELDDVYENAGGTIDAICVTHLADDHLGDCLDLALEYQTPVITEPGTMHYLQEKGVPEDQITKLVWGMTAKVDNLAVRSLETHHFSNAVVDGDYVTGLPMGFLLSTNETSIYHMGDTSIFSDLKLIGELYDPDVTLLGVGRAHADNSKDGPVTRISHELTTEEALTVARWVGTDTVVPMHYLPGEREAFLEAWADVEDGPDVVPLDPGETLEI